MLFTLIKNELIKLLRRGKTWIVFGLFVLFVGLNVFSQYQTDKNTRAYMTIEYKLSSSKAELERVNEEIKLVEEDKSVNPEYRNALTQNKEVLENNIKNYENMINSGITEEDQWKSNLDTNIAELKAQIEEYSKYDDEWSAKYKEEAQEQLETYQYLKDNNIKPLYNWEYQSYGFLNNLMEFLSMAILLCGIAVFMSDIVSGECTPATLKFLLVQPVTRGKVLLSKFIAVTLTVIAMVIGAEAAGFFFIKLTSSIDGSDYPVRLHSLYEITSNGVLSRIPGSGYMASNSELVIKSLLFQSLFIFTGCAVVFMISTLIKSSMITMAVSVISTVFITIASFTISSLNKINHLIFVNYANSVNLVTGNLAQSFGNPNMTTNMALIVMIATSIIALAVAYISFNKKDILI
ncbi:MAG: ABC transporter permease subunit [Clostridium sp.]|nr:ABC transporter permease subunit [Clostridium sp.]